MDNEAQSVLQILVRMKDEFTEPLHEMQENLEGFSSSFEGIAAAAGGLFAGYEALEHVVEPAAAMQDQMVGTGGDPRHHRRTS